ncbi:MAG: 4Fe-4S binding protein [Thermocladium sp.]
MIDSMIISESLGNGLGDALLRGFIDSSLNLRTTVLISGGDLAQWGSSYMPIRGSLLVIVMGDADCPWGAICMRPRGEAVINAVKEAINYSEVVEVPYVAMMDEESMRDAHALLREKRRRPPVFNKNWIMGYRWLNRSARGDRINWALHRLTSLGVDASYSPPQQSRIAAPPSPIAAADFIYLCLYKSLYDPVNEVGVPLVITRTDMVRPITGEKARGNFNPRPLAFLPRTAAEVPDMAVSKPLVAVHEAIRVGYDYGPIVGVMREEDLMNGLLGGVLGKAGLIVIGEEGDTSCDDVALAPLESRLVRVRDIEATQRRPRILTDYCDACGDCLRLGCSAIGVEAGHPIIDSSKCIGCGLCLGVCSRDAIQWGN